MLNEQIFVLLTLQLVFAAVKKAEKIAETIDPPTFVELSNLMPRAPKVIHQEDPVDVPYHISPLEQIVKTIDVSKQEAKSSPVKVNSIVGEIEESEYIGKSNLVVYQRVAWLEYLAGVYIEADDFVRANEMIQRLWWWTFENRFSSDPTAVCMFVEFIAS